ncbi:hypothetical protein TWF569_003159 [Orbilia oligospora]|uniref:Uncharacterized protein n=1 Tax=Orbilia oligospora TaxID=2813651 RepID=A0A7C8N2J9_ORBOL|nr:hypothetical protein TWF102_010632 [Orbilia oligospora]KAF3100495.1 hypothetical protein TWF103_008217 [Orbilia oligospora]KAF3110939.1 hypothetical protein TWF706_000398 [Orbilia oligospora]KAF3120424.1 hypothetical protein TWF569_003159 [Orbilia oligospora]KAF3139071.1 hypothetical protein TWF594_006822 [Orbilia oligospora]
MDINRTFDFQGTALSNFLHQLGLLLLPLQNLNLDTRRSTNMFKDEDITGNLMSHITDPPEQYSSQRCKAWDMRNHREGVFGAVCLAVSVAAIEEGEENIYKH